MVNIHQHQWSLHQYQPKQCAFALENPLKTLNPFLHCLIIPKTTCSSRTRGILFKKKYVLKGSSDFVPEIHIHLTSPKGADSFVFCSAVSRFLVAWFLCCPDGQRLMCAGWRGKVERRLQFFFKRRKVTFWWEKNPGYAELHTNLPNVFFWTPNFRKRSSTPPTSFNSLPLFNCALCHYASNSHLLFRRCK